MSNLYWVSAFLLLILTNSATATSGDFVNNGGGSAEHNFMYAYQHLSEFIQNCLDSSACEMNDQDKSLLASIKSSLPQEGTAANLLIFKTSAEENFYLDGAIRVAKTGNYIGTKIFINRYMIYELNDSRLSAMSIPHAAGILVHELGHHLGQIDHTYLDYVAVKFRLFLQRTVISSTFDPRLFLRDNAFESIPYLPSFTVLYLNPTDSWRPDTRLLIHDSSTGYDLTDLLLPSLERFNDQEISQGEYRLCSREGDGGVISEGRIAGVDLLSPRWEQSFFYKPFGGTPYFVLRLNFILQVICFDQASGHRWTPTGVLYELALKFDKSGSQLVYRPTEDLQPTILYRDPFD